MGYEDDLQKSVNELHSSLNAYEQARGARQLREAWIQKVHPLVQQHEALLRRKDLLKRTIKLKRAEESLNEVRRKRRIEVDRKRDGMSNDEAAFLDKLMAIPKPPDNTSEEVTKDDSLTQLDAELAELEKEITAKQVEISRLEGEIGYSQE